MRKWSVTVYEQEMSIMNKCQIQVEMFWGMILCSLW
jgi:hypothetical protein